MKEFRCIVFSEHEVINAVIDRRRRAKEKIPQGTILDVKFAAKGKNNTTATIRIVDDYGSEECLVVQTSELVAALIVYCMNRRVPLPNGANRWIELIGTSDLTLIMDFNPFGLGRGKPGERQKKIKK